LLFIEAILVRRQASLIDKQSIILYFNATIVSSTGPSGTWKNVESCKKKVILLTSSYPLDTIWIGIIDGGYYLIMNAPRHPDRQGFP
jgi:hypothetical protein